MLFRVDFFALGSGEPTFTEHESADEAVARFNSETGAGRCALLSTRSSVTGEWMPQFKGGEPITA